MEIWDDQDVNSFGTDEFISLSGKMEWTPMIAVNLGTGTPEEAASERPGDRDQHDGENPEDERERHADLDVVGESVASGPVDQQVRLVPDRRREGGGRRPSGRTDGDDEPARGKVGGQGGLVPDGRARRGDPARPRRRG